MEEITITGGSGFLGTTLTEALEENQGIFSQFSLREDVLKNRTGTLVHLAGSISERESYLDPVKYINNNIILLANILKANKYDKVIFPSSTTVYDAVGKENPSSVYGITKLACEQLVKTYTEKFWILRISNPYGMHDKKSAFAKLAQCKKMNEVFTIYNSSEVIRNFFPVYKLVNFISKIISGSVGPGTFDVCSSKVAVSTDLLLSLCRKYDIRHTLVDPPNGISSGYVPSNGVFSSFDDNKEDIFNDWEKYYLN